ncbi:hypothetical protein JTB14_031864 [Gonioctena quinquepunctata]|nr:hypothetical protein JTB14_031864 [Gonioctena quinquepunctata]
MGTALVNSYILHQEVANDNMPITKFKERIISEMRHLPSETLDTPAPADEPPAQHYLEESHGASRKRGRCVRCYKNKTEEVCRKAAANQATQSKFRCVAFKKYYCLSCFFEVHKCFIE